MRRILIFAAAVVGPAVLGCGGGGSSGSGPLVAGRLTLPASAFTPQFEEYVYAHDDGVLRHSLTENPPNDGETWAGATYFAPVHVPDGALFQKFTLYFSDSSAASATAELLRTRLITGPNAQLMASLESTDSFALGGLGSVSTTEIEFASTGADNLRYEYFVSIRFFQPAVPTDGSLGVQAIGVDYVAPQTPPSPSHLSVPPAAFRPFYGGQLLVNHGDELYSGGLASDPAAQGTFLAPVHLPDGAEVQDLHLYWERRTELPSLFVTQARLQRTQLGTANYEDLAVVGSDTGEGMEYRESSASVAPTVVIDNAVYAYWIAVSIPSYENPGGFIVVRDVVLTYLPPTEAPGRRTTPAAAFRPPDETIAYEDHGRYLIHEPLPGSFPAPDVFADFVAPLELPDGATVTGFRFYWDEDTVVAGEARLRRQPLGGLTATDVAHAFTTTAGAGNGSSEDLSLQGAVIDNTAYEYWLVWSLPEWQPTLGQSVRGHAVVVSYTE